jgi:Kef-type K+ transport system membrane component KefB
MTSIVVAGIVLLVALLGPLRDQTGPPRALWALGLLIILPYTLQRLTRALHVPPIVGWLAGGVLLGATGLGLVQPADLAPLALLACLAGVWVGFQVGLHFAIPSGFGWRGPALITTVTLATALLATGAIALAAEPPWWLALLLGTLAAFWGPFSIVPSPARRGALLLACVGAGAAVLLLSAALVLLHVRGPVPASALVWIARLWGSLLAGAVGAEVLRRLGLLVARSSTLAAALLAVSLVAALLVQHLELFSLPFGFGAGLVLVQQRVPARRLRLLLRSSSPVAFMLFFALLGAAIDLRELWPLPPQVVRILVAQILVVVIVRGVGPALFYPLAVPDSRSRRRLGWMLLPRGALLFELVYHPQQSILRLLGDGPAQLVGQVALADIMVHVVLFSILAGFAQRWLPPVAVATSDPRGGATPAEQTGAQVDASSGLTRGGP